jgi:small-conductance mechanosensitive channel
LANLAGWVFIVWRHPFRVGDRVQIGEHAGDVVDLRIFQFSLMEIRNWVEADQSTGKIIHIPNGIIFTSPLANYTHGFNYLWNEIPITITFESDWEKAPN